MAAGISLSDYQTVNEHLTIRLSKCRRTYHYPAFKLSTNTTLNGYKNVNEQPTIRSTKCPRTSHYTLIKMKYSLEKKHEKNEVIIFTLVVRVQLSGDKQPAVIEYS